MTVKQNRTPAQEIQQLFREASKTEEAKDFWNTAMLLAKAQAVIDLHFGSESVSPHLLHAEMHLHWASLYRRFDAEHQSIAFALKGLHVINLVVAVPPENQLWQRLMGFMSHH